ncbi:MAG TPA: SgcJ/EcaC family oxidoreductase [Polyangia bacterium]
MRKDSKINARSLWLALPVAMAVIAGAGPLLAAGSSKDEDAVKARVAEFIALFNKGDAKGMASFWADDATLVNPAGQAGKGPAEIDKVISHDLATILKDARMEMKVIQFRSIGKDAAWVEIEHSVAGAKGPDGKAMPPMTFHVPTLMLKKGKSWVIAEARPYAYLPPLPPPTAATGGGAPAMAGAAPSAGASAKK